VTSPAALEAAIRQAQTERRDALLLRIQRRGGPAGYVAVRLR
jgi:serine protease Do